MPRTPDPELEDRIVAAAMRLLDRGGEGAITMRAVAAEAGTTTPTIYERFPDREALMRRVAKRGTDEVFAVLQPFRRGGEDGPRVPSIQLRPSLALRFDGRDLWRAVCQQANPGRRSIS